MIRRPPRSTHCESSAASDVYKRQLLATGNMAQDSADSSVAGPTPLIAKESEIIKAQAENANDLSIIISVLEISDV